MKVHCDQLNEDDIAKVKNLGMDVSSASDWRLSRNQDGFLCLSSSKLSAIKPVFVDFCSGKSIFKRNSMKNKGQPLVKAVGFKSKQDRLLDLTAGYGEDALMFAAIGFQVTSLERNPLIFLLLQDALDRLKTFEDRDPIVVEERLKFVFSDAVEYIQKHQDQQFQCVYYDPMFENEGKTALSSGRMQILQLLTAGQPQGEEIVVKAVLEGKITNRLIVKQSLKQKNTLPQPIHSYKGKSVRYDLLK